MRTTGQHPWAVVLMQSAATVVMLGTLCYLQSMHWHMKRESARLQLCSNVVTTNDAAVTLPPACTSHTHCCSHYSVSMISPSSQEVPEDCRSKVAPSSHLSCVCSPWLEPCLQAPQLAVSHGLLLTITPDMPLLSQTPPVLATARSQSPPQQGCCQLPSYKNCIDKIQTVILQHPGSSLHQSSQAVNWRQSMLTARLLTKFTSL